MSGKGKSSSELPTLGKERIIRIITKELSSVQHISVGFPSVHGKKVLVNLIFTVPHFFGVKQDETWVSETKLRCSSKVDHFPEFEICTCSSPA